MDLLSVLEPNDGHIETTYEPDPHDPMRMVLKEVTLEGGPLFRASARFMEEYDPNGVCPPLRIIDREDWNGSCVVVVDDWRGQMLVVAYRLKLSVDVLYRTAIYLADIWGLATVSPGTMASWRDVHLLRRIAEWLEE